MKITKHTHGYITPKRIKNLFLHDILNQKKLVHDKNNYYSPMTAYSIT